MTPFNSGARSESTPSPVATSGELSGAATPNDETLEESTSEAEKADDEPEPFDPATLPTLDEKINGKIERGNEALLQLAPEDRQTLGRVVFLCHCNDCHAAARGYSAVGPRVVGRTRAELIAFELKLNFVNYYMPPWSGTEVEAELLSDYLTTLVPRYPVNIISPPREKPAPETDESDETVPSEILDENGEATVNAI
ncbi:MAG: hypothetical protein HUK22_07790 [Thermoguttaceae bacterium]|nr:hypothetical protein [Thermoguttaceae bacterium]